MTQFLKNLFEIIIHYLLINLQYIKLSLNKINGNISVVILSLICFIF